jgi:hypothetical protein
MKLLIRNHRKITCSGNWTENAFDAVIELMKTTARINSTDVLEYLQKYLIR